MRAKLMVVFNVATVQLYDEKNEFASPAWSVLREDGPGPVPAAEVVLKRQGWQVAGGWVQTAGGVSGAVWEVGVEKLP